MRRSNEFFIAACRIAAITLLFFVLADAAAALVLTAHERASPAINANRLPDAYFTSANHAWPADYFDEADAVELRWHPFSYWLGAPFAGKYFNIGKDGLRRTWHDGFTGVRSAGRPLRIFLFGGSAMWGYGAADDDTIPSALVRTLAQRGVSARVANFGQLGYVSTQELILFFEQLRKGNIPGLVIFYDGFNDTAAAFQNGAPGITENEINRAREFNALNNQQAGRALYTRALVTFISHLAIFRVARAVAVRLRPGGPQSPEFETADWVGLTARAGLSKDLPQDVVTVYLANVKLIAQTGKRVGYRSLFYWQPALYGRKRMSAFEENQKARYAPGEERFFLAVWAAARKASSDQSLPRDERPIYLNDKMPLDMPCFIDAAHISGACNEVVAQIVAGDIIRLSGAADMQPGGSPVIIPGVAPKVNQ